MTKKTIPLVIFGLAGAIIVPARAQTAPSGSTRARAEAAGAQGAPVNNNAAIQAGSIMQRTGASLLQAQLSAQADPSQAKLSQISFFAVPEPTPKTLKKHDLVTIVIREESDIQSKGSTDLQKNAILQAHVNEMVKLKLSNLSIYGLPAPTTPTGIDLDGTRNFKGTGEVDRTDSLTARITAEVVDVKPNGTLVLQARKHIKTDDEEQTFILTGTCRVDDVGADNTVLSTQISDLELQKNHNGAVKKSTERGILPKLLDFLNPF